MLSKSYAQHGAAQLNYVVWQFAPLQDSLNSAPAARSLACSAPQAKILVDGAHALGQMPLAIEALGADYFVANCHKWLCSPRGAAILWVRRQCQDGFQPLVKSHGLGCGFCSDFVWSGAHP